MSWETRVIKCNANNKDTDQTALWHSLISASVVRSVYIYHINTIAILCSRLKRLILPDCMFFTVYSSKYTYPGKHENWDHWVPRASVTDTQADLGTHCTSMHFEMTMACFLIHNQGAIGIYKFTKIEECRIRTLSVRSCTVDLTCTMCLLRLWSKS